MFGRGGEEALALKAAGVAFEVVPGVSSALAAPAAASIPVTHRGVSARCSSRPVTIRSASRSSPRRWRPAPRRSSILMGTSKRAEIVDALDRRGMARARCRPPSSGTRRCPSRASGPARSRSSPTRARVQCRPHAPGTIVVGDVVGLREWLTTMTRGWQESQEAVCHG